MLVRACGVFLNKRQLRQQGEVEQLTMNAQVSFKAKILSINKGFHSIATETKDNKS